MYIESAKKNGKAANKLRRLHATELSQVVIYLPGCLCIFVLDFSFSFCVSLSFGFLFDILFFFIEEKLHKKRI